MSLILNRLLNPLLLFLFLTQSVSVQAQFWKKLKNKATEKLRKTEDKIINKLDTKSDKIIDSTLSGKNASKEKKSKLNDNIVDGKSYGKASINHSSTYSLLDIKNVTSIEPVWNEMNNVLKVKNCSFENISIKFLEFFM